MSLETTTPSAGTTLIRFKGCYLSQVDTRLPCGTLRYCIESVKFLPARMLSDLLANPGIEHRHSYALLCILKLWPDKARDCGDAVLAAAAQWV